MRMKASEVGDWLRQIVGKRDRREVVPDDNDLVLRPGPNFHLLNPVTAQNPLITQVPSPTPERSSPSDVCGEAGAVGHAFGRGSRERITRDNPLYRGTG